MTSAKLILEEHSHVVWIWAPAEISTQSEKGICLLFTSKIGSKCTILKIASSLFVSVLLC